MLCPLYRRIGVNSTFTHAHTHTHTHSPTHLPTHLTPLTERAPGAYKGGDRRGERTCDEWQL